MQNIPPLLMPKRGSCEQRKRGQRGNAVFGGTCSMTQSLPLSSGAMWREGCCTHTVKTPTTTTTRLLVGDFAHCLWTRGSD